MAQFAALIRKSIHLFAQIIETATTKEITPLLQVSASSYWDTHYHFDEAQQRTYPKTLGADSIENIIINTIAPVQFLYAYYHGKTDEQERALQLLSSIHPESNKVMTVWKQYGWKPANAAQSQALLQLFNNYCSHKRCLECSIGLSVLKSKPVK